MSNPVTNWVLYFPPSLLSNVFLWGIFGYFVIPLHLRESGMFQNEFVIFSCKKKKKKVQSLPDFGYYHLVILVAHVVQAQVRWTCDWSDAARLSSSSRLYSRVNVALMRTDFGQIWPQLYLAGRYKVLHKQNISYIQMYQYKQTIVVL